MMRTHPTSVVLTSVLGALVLGLVACSGEETMAPEAPQVASVESLTDVQKAAQVADAIQADPSSADAALEEAGMTEEAYLDLLYAIAEDPEKSAEFLDARK